MKEYIKIVNLSKKVKGNVLLDNINLTIDKGQIIGIVGLNGSGKSTLFKCILNLYKYTGNIYINDKDVKKQLKNIGFIIEGSILINEYTAKENLTYWGRFYKVSKKRIEEVLEIINLNIKKKVKFFSLGMKEKLSIGISILSSPPVLLLDEPTNGLDIKSIIKLRNMILSMENTTTIISSHNINELTKICDKIILIDKGKIKEEISREDFNQDIETRIINRLGEIKHEQFN